MLRRLAVVLLASSAVIGCGGIDAPGISSSAAPQDCYQPWSEYEEPSLCHAGSTEVRTFRFIWERSFHEPAMIRVQERPDGMWSVRTTLLARESHSAPLLPIVDKERVLPAERVSPLLALLVSESEFWSMPAKLDRIPSVDGARWIVEARDGSAYHYVNRQSPHEGEVVHDLGLAFIELSGHDFHAIY
jgi:hypothetical protein